MKLTPGIDTRNKIIMHLTGTNKNCQVCTKMHACGRLDRPGLVFLKLSHPEEPVYNEKCLRKPTEVFKVFSGTP